MIRKDVEFPVPHRKIFLKLLQEGQKRLGQEREITTDCIIVIKQ